MAKGPVDPPLTGPPRKVRGSYKRKQFPANLDPCYEPAFREREKTHGWRDAKDTFLAVQKADGISEQQARAANREKAERDLAEPKKEASEPSHIDIDTAFRLLFPWATAAFTISPAAWGVIGGPNGDERPAEPHDLPIDWIVEGMLVSARGSGRSRDVVETTGFRDFYLAARAGIFRAAVAAAWKFERVDHRRREGGVLPRLKALAEKANALSMQVGKLADEFDPRDVLPFGPNTFAPVEAAQVRARLRYLDEALDDCRRGAQGLVSLTAICDVEIERFALPKASHHTWAATFAEALAETWRDLTGARPRRGVRFTGFVATAYQTIAPKAPPHNWAETARKAAESLRDRDGPSSFAMESLEASMAARRLDQEILARDIRRRLPLTRASYPLRDVRLSEILYLEAARRDPRFRPFVDSILSGDA